MRIHKTEQTTKISKAEALELAQKLVDEQNFQRAMFYGVGAALFSIVAWYFVVESTGLIFSAYGLAVGAIVGYSVRLGGKGLSVHYLLVAFLLSVGACVAGNFWSIYELFGGLVLPYSEERFDLLVDATVIEVALYGVTYVDALMWISAGGLGAFLSQRQLDREQRYAMSLYRLSRT